MTFFLVVCFFSSSKKIKRIIRYGIIYYVIINYLSKVTLYWRVRVTYLMKVPGLIENQTRLYLHLFFSQSSETGPRGDSKVTPY